MVQSANCELPKFLVQIDIDKIFLGVSEKVIIFVAAKRYGSLAEWLGTGLQNRLRRFESARNLTNRNETVFKRQPHFLFVVALQYY